MYDHVGLKVKDVEKSVRFYKEALGALGHVLGSQDESGAGFGPEERRLSGFTPSRARPGRACMWPSVPPIALPSTASTSRASRPAAATMAEPGLRADYSPSYYAAFLIDPDGNNVEAVCLT